MDISKINLDSGIQKTIHDNLEVYFDNNQIKFNIFSLLSYDSALRDYNLALFDSRNSNKIVKFGLSANTNIRLDSIYSELRLRGNIYFEKDGQSFELNINSIITPIGTSNIPVESTNNSTSIFTTEEEVINHLITEINALKSKVYHLELSNAVNDRNI